MKTASTKIALAFTGILAASSVSGLVLASESKAASQENAAVYVIESIKIPGHAKSVLADTRAARVALFEGQTDAAIDLVQKALDTFDAGVADYAVELDDDAGFGIPVDSSVEFNEGFQPTESNAKVINQAGQLAQKGDSQAAVKTMIEGGIELDFKYAMLPVAPTVVSLNNALDDLQDGSFYEANIVLKAIETSLVIEDYGVADTPKQGFAWETISKS
ncbi:YfdX family protein [Aliamphritea spongicola]|uniref:YfdX family protein n=1 Tax=Aliamphritea spongicola TaxID=707589 RepID=UPI00196A7494|nr:YfdX family protein [Aliamphritea spongicola]MBN3561610.1 YfdX family protein [Aliamphritea spongicola]